MSRDEQVRDDKVQVSPASRALERSIRRALRKHKRARKKLDPKPVHDLRVALRRCRSLAEGFSAIDPDPVWRRLRKASKQQQSGLSDLRDVQVLANWVEPLRLGAGPAGAALASHFKKRERRAEREARSSLKSLPRKRWKRWLRWLPARAELIPVNERRLAQLVLEQLTHVIDLHRHWTKEPGPETWHELRVTVKRFRYMVESFLPEKSAAWSAELQRAQDLLGEGHDLDVLHDLITRLARKKPLPKPALSQWLQRIDRAAEKRQREYAQLISKPPHRQGRSDGESSRADFAEDADPQTLWDRWRTELAAMGSVNRPDDEESSRSAARRESRARARASRYPGRRLRTSSAR
jgi:CHAD domain-containing protein